MKKCLKNSFINKQGMIFLALAIIYVSPVLAQISYSDCQVYGNCKPTNIIAAMASSGNSSCSCVSGLNGTDGVSGANGTNIFTSINTTQMDNSTGMLNILESWLKGIFYSKSEIDTKIITNTSFLTTYNLTYAGWAYNQSPTSSMLDKLYGCEEGKILKRSGSAWECSDDATGSGATYNSTYAATTLQWNANYSILAGCVNNASYLSTYNETYAGLMNNDSYLSTYNLTYDNLKKSYDNNFSSFVVAANCSAGTVVMNITHSGVQCVTPTAAMTLTNIAFINQTNDFGGFGINVSNITIGNLVVINTTDIFLSSGRLKTSGFTINTIINGSDNITTTKWVNSNGLNIGSGSNISFGTTDGQGISFFGGTTDYAIFMGTSERYGKLDTSSDYNMYFDMAGGTNRGFVFRVGSGVTTFAPVVQIDASGNIHMNGTLNVTNNVNILKNLNVTENVTVGKLLRITWSTLGACGKGNNGTIGRNVTGLFYCASNSTWTRLAAG